MAYFFWTTLYVSDTYIVWCAYRSPLTKIARLSDGTKRTLSVLISFADDIFFSIVSHLIRRVPTFSSSHEFTFGIRLLQPQQAEFVIHVPFIQSIGVFTVICCLTMSGAFEVTLAMIHRLINCRCFIIIIIIIIINVLLESPVAEFRIILNMFLVCC